MSKPKAPRSYADFSNRLADLIAMHLGMWSRRLHFETMRVLDLGCFPWHGYLELSFLTTQELFEESNEDDKWKHLASWRWYNFNEELQHWEEFRVLEKWIQEKRLTPLFEACAKTLTSQVVLKELQNYKLTPDFQLSVFHPDYSGTHNYCQAFLTEDSWIKVIKPMRTA